MKTASMQRGETIGQIVDMDFFYTITRMVLALPEDDSSLKTYYNVHRQVFAFFSSNQCFYF